MTIKQLKEAIKYLPDHMDVFVGERLTEDKCGLVNSASVSNITVGSEEDIDYKEVREVLILSEE